MQRAAYALMSPDEQQRMHLQIGRLVLASAGGDPADRLFDVVSHLNRAVALIDDPARIRELARLEVAAACKARDSAAYAAAGEFLRVALEALRARLYIHANDMPAATACIGAARPGRAARSAATIA